MHAELAAQPYSPLITLMTADYLLTARQLPGWPGSFPPIDYRELLLKSLDELVDGLFAENRVARELAILHRIAEHHGLGGFFQKRVKAARRNLRKTLEGNAISPRRVYLNCSQYGIHNVFDAAYFARSIHQITTKSNLASVRKVLANSLIYRLRSLRVGNHLPVDSPKHFSNGG